MDYGSCCVSLFNSSDDGDGSYDDSYYLVYEYEEFDHQLWYKNRWTTTNLQDYTKEEEMGYASWIGDYFGCDWGGNHLCSQQGDGSFESQLHPDYSGDHGWGYGISNEDEEGVNSDRWAELYDTIFGY